MKSIIEDHFRTPVKDYEQIHIGNSAGEKARFSVAGKQYFAKEIPNDTREKYDILTCIAEEIPEAVIPFDFINSPPDRLIAISAYIEGNTLDTIYQTLSPNERILVGEKAGVFMKRLHSLTRRCRSDEKSNISEADITQAANTYVDPNNRSSFFDLIERRRLNAHRSEYSLIHRDMRPQNIVLTYDGSIRVIDFDNAKAAPPLYDLSLCLMLSSKYHEFSFGIVRGYCGPNIEADFWREIKEQIAWQLIEYSIRYANDTVSIRRKFNQLTAYITGSQQEPPWWKTIEEKRGLSEYL